MSSTSKNSDSDSSSTKGDKSGSDTRKEAASSKKNNGNSSAPAKPPVSPLGSIKRLLVFGVAAFVLWLVFVQLLPRFVGIPEYDGILLPVDQAETQPPNNAPQKDAAPAAKPVTPDIPEEDTPATKPKSADEQPSIEEMVQDDLSRMMDETDISQAEKQDTPAETESAAEEEADEPAADAQTNAAETDAQAEEKAKLESAEKRIQALEAQLNQLSLLAAEQPVAQQAAMSVLESKLLTQAEEIERLRTRQHHSLRVMGLMDAHDRLKEKMLTGHPFVSELERMRQSAGGWPEVQQALEPLEPFASTGIPRLTFLQSSYDKVAGRALAATAMEGSSNQIWSTVKANLYKVITIRPVGDVPGDSPEAVIARAETQLDEGKVEAAYLTLSRLEHDSPAASEMREWQTHATAYMRRDDVLRNLKTALLNVQLAPETPVTQAVTATQPQPSEPAKESQIQSLEIPVEPVPEKAAVKKSKEERHKIDTDALLKAMPEMKIIRMEGDAVSTPEAEPQP